MKHIFHRHPKKVKLQNSNVTIIILKKRYISDEDKTKKNNTGLTVFITHAITFLFQIVTLIYTYRPRGMENYGKFTPIEKSGA